MDDASGDAYIVTVYVTELRHERHPNSPADENVKCIHCKGTMHEGTAPFSVDRNGYHVQWDAVPAWVCKQCGEALFEQAEVERIHRALVALDAAQATEAA